MDQLYKHGETFEKVISESPLPKGEYEGCIFKNWDFSNQSLGEFRFIECEFVDCNLSVVNVNKTEFQTIKFTRCKILGMHFENCSQFGLSFSFEHCQLDHSSFYKTKIKKTVFKESSLRECDFSECDLTDARFDKCDFTDATFDNTILEKADFRTSLNYSIDPERNKIKKAKFALSGVRGLLDKYDIDIEG
jgi:fluoroquinolone resistance protein